MTSPQKFDLHDYLQLIVRRRLAIVGCGLLVFGASVAYSLLSTAQYRASAEIVIGQTDSITLVGSDATTAAEQRQVIQTEVRYLGSRLVDDAAEARLGYEAEIDAGLTDESSVLTVTAISDDPAEAADIANTYAEVYIELRREARIAEYLSTAEVVQERIADIDQQILAAGPFSDNASRLEAQRDGYVEILENLALGADLSGGVSTQIISSAEIPEQAFAPRTYRNGIIGALLGLMLGIGLAFIREFLDQSVKDKAALESATGSLPTLAMIPATPMLEQNPNAVITLVDGRAPSAEAYRTLRAALQFIAINRDVQVVQLTSANPREGKSTTTVNLAASLAQLGKRVAIVDGDLRRPRIHRFFGVDQRPGVTDILRGDAAVADCFQHGGQDDIMLGVLPAGPVTEHAAEALSSHASYEMLKTLREQVDIVLVDSPPVLPVADSVVLSGLVDAVIFVAKVKGSTKKEISRAVEMLRQVDAPLIGTVLNDSDDQHEDRSGYGYGYSADDEYDQDGANNGSSSGSKSGGGLLRRQAAKAPAPVLKPAETLLPSAPASSDIWERAAVRSAPRTATTDPTDRAGVQVGASR